MSGFAICCEGLPDRRNEIDWVGMAARYLSLIPAQQTDLAIRIAAGIAKGRHLPLPVCRILLGSGKPEDAAVVIGDRLALMIERSGHRPDWEEIRERTAALRSSSPGIGYLAGIVESLSQPLPAA